MALPCKDAYCNRPDGSLWSLWYSVLPETGEKYWVQFEYAVKLKKNLPHWSVTQCSIMDNSKMEASDTHHNLQLDKAGTTASAKDYYNNESPYAGDYAMRTPVIKAYRNKSDGTVWSIKYKTTPDAGGEVFVKFEYQAAKQKTGGIKWQVVHMGITDPSAKEVRPASNTGKPRSSGSKKGSGGGDSASNHDEGRKRKKSEKKAGGDQSKKKKSRASVVQVIHRAPPPCGLGAVYIVRGSHRRHAGGGGVRGGGG